MDFRLSRVEYGCSLALAASKRSEDPHTQNGACLLDSNGIVLSTGFNGLAPGMKIPEWMFKQENRPKKSMFMIHAESNVFRWRNNTIGEPYTLCITNSPCEACAKTIVSNGVKEVFYIEKYEKDPNYHFKEIFNFYGVNHRELTAHEKKRIGILK